MATISSTIRINDAFSSVLDKLSSGLSKSQSGFDKLKNGMSGNFMKNPIKSTGIFFKSAAAGTAVGNLVSKGMGLAATGVRSLAGEFNEASMAWQTFEGNMHQIGKSPAQIAAAKKDMQQFAQKTIYSASDMSSTYSQLASVGVKNTGKLVKGFGGLASAAMNPAQAMKTLSEQATQMAAKPQVQWQDFKLMMEQTPAGMAAVAKSMGSSLQDLIANIQDGKVSTEDFFKAIEKTGTNANFSKMATQYKTVGQALDGLKETIVNGAMDGFQKLSNIGIKAVESLTDSLSNVDFSKITDGITSAIKYIQPLFNGIKQAIQDFFSGLQSSGIGDSVSNLFKTLADSAQKLMDKFNSFGKTNLAKVFGNFSGSALAGAVDMLSGMIDALSKMDPGTIKTLAMSFMILKSSTKGLVVTGIVTLLAALEKINPSVAQAVGKGLMYMAMAITIFTAAYKAAKGIGALSDLFSGMKKVKTPEISMPEVPSTPKSGGILQSAGAFMKLGAALLMVGGAVVLVAIGFKLIADAATQLASGGVATIAIFFGMLVAIAALALVVKLLGPTFIGAAAGFLLFAIALFLIGAAVFIASAGLALLATQLPIISQYAGSGALGILMLGLAIAAFGILAIVGAIGIAILAVAIVVLGIALVIAAAGALIFAVALALIGVGALVAAIGIILLGVGLTLIAVFALIAAVGMLLLGVGLALVAVFAIVAAVGFIMMGAGLIIVALMSIIAAVGMILLAAGLILVAPLTLIAAIGMLLLGVALILVGPMALLAGVGLLMMGVGLILVGPMSMIAAVGLLLMAVALILVAPMAMLAGVVLLLLGVAAIIAGAGLILVAAGAMAAAVALITLGVAIMVLVSLFIAAGQKLVQAITTAMHNVVDAVRNGIQNAVNAAKGFANALVSVGRDLIQGLINGIKSMIDAAVSAVTSVARSVVSAAKSILHIGSPSRLFRQYGRWIDQGLIIGLNKDAGAVANASRIMAQGVVDAASNMTPTMNPLEISDSNPGDQLADGFNDALLGVNAVARALNNLDGTNAEINLSGFGSYGLNEDQTGINSNTPRSSAITPSTVSTNSTTSATDNSTAINIEQGAIVIQGSGNTETDADTLVSILERKIIELQNRAL